MNRDEFLKELNDRIKTYPDHNDIISYYYELISDKIESGMTEEEAVESLGSIGSIVKNIEETNDSKIEANDAITFVEEKNNNSYNRKTEADTNNPKTENNTTEKTTSDNNNKELSGGRKFAYVLWCIASVIFCIASVIITIVSVTIAIAGVICIAAGAITMIDSIAGGLFIIGGGIFVIGFAVVAIHFSNVLRRFIFSNRDKWNDDIKKKAMGN